MTRIAVCASLSLACLLSAVCASADPGNRLIDYAAFEAEVAAVGRLRAARRVDEATFLRMAAEPATVILDARSRERYAELHVRGAKNLPLPDVTEAELARLLPSKSTRVLIYCNNNFLGEPVAFASKAPAASLNVHTFTTLTAYGYTNVWELGPLVEVDATLIPLVGARSRR